MLAFTKQERVVLIFLAVAFLIGSAIRLYQNRWQSLPTLAEPDVQSVERPLLVDTMRMNRETGEEMRIDINRAEHEALIKLPGIGPVMADRIIAYRDRQGGFASIEELMEVKGIGVKTFQRIKKFLIVE